MELALGTCNAAQNFPGWCFAFAACRRIKNVWFPLWLAELLLRFSGLAWLLGP